MLIKVLVIILLIFLAATIASFGVTYFDRTPNEKWVKKYLVTLLSLFIAIGLVISVFISLIHDLEYPQDKQIVSELKKHYQITDVEIAENNTVYFTFHKSKCFGLFEKSETKYRIKIKSNDKYDATCTVITNFKP